MRNMSTASVKSHPVLQLAPSNWVARWSRLLASGDEVLDFASGAGRNHAPLLARRARVTAVDRDTHAIAALDPSVEAIVADLERGSWPFANRRFAMVVCCNYLFRPRLDLLLDLVASGGALVYETFARGNEAFGRPSNPDYLLRPGELLDAARRGGLDVLAYEHGRVDAPRPAVIQRICAIRGQRAAGGWPAVG